jgi:predicted HicB family RNase H-like nuclease
MQMKPLLLRLPVDVHRRLKIMAAEHDVSMKAFLIGKILEGDKTVESRVESVQVESTPVAVS